MAGPVTSPATPIVPTQASASQKYGKSLALLASLFFMWGFITVINNTLLPHLRSVFELNYTQTTLIESVWFIAYGVASMPSAFLIERVGYKKAIVIAVPVGLSGVNSVVAIPAEARVWIVAVTTFLLSVARAAMGLETDTGKLAAKGFRPALLGALAFLFIAGFSLTLIKLVG